MINKGDRMVALAHDITGDETPAAFYLGYFILFNQQRYYQAHDVLEHLWLSARGPSGLFFKGLIQFAGAFVHLQKQRLRPDHPTDARRTRPASRLFGLAEKNLTGYEANYLDCDLRSIIELCRVNFTFLLDHQYTLNPWNPEQPPLLKTPKNFREALMSSTLP